MTRCSCSRVIGRRGAGRAGSTRRSRSGADPDSWLSRFSAGGIAPDVALPEHVPLLLRLPAVKQRHRVERACFCSPAGNE